MDQAQGVAQECGVSAMPTFHFYLGGRKVDELRGADPQRLQELVARHGASSVLAGGSGSGSGSFSGTGYRLGGDGTTSSQPDTSGSITAPLDSQATIQAILNLGFSRQAALAGIEATGTTETETVVDWVLQNASPPNAEVKVSPPTSPVGDGAKTTLAMRCSPILTQLMPRR